jgi:hypothetical protein
MLIAAPIRKQGFRGSAVWCAIHPKRATETIPICSNADSGHGGGLWNRQPGANIGDLI